MSRIKPITEMEPSLPIEEWLSLLPYEISKAALNNLWSQSTGHRASTPSFIVRNMGDAINQGIVWDMTPEGANYWERIWSQYRTSVYADFLPSEEIEIEFTL